MSPWGGAASCQSVSMRYSVSFLISCGLAHVSVHTLWRLGANIVAGHVSVHTLWRLGALFALSTRSGASAHCLHCPHALEARRSSGGSAHCLQQFWRLGALSTFASMLSQTHLMNAPSNSVCFQFRLMMLLWSVCIVHTFWRLNALFAARANGGYSCPQALEETQADIVAFCRE